MPLNLNIVVGPLVAIIHTGSNARILAPTKGLLHSFAVYGAKGLFSKDHEPTRAFGRALCDDVKGTFNCDGFFTTDEIPRYGLTVHDRSRLFELYRQADPVNDVLVMCTYPKALASAIREFMSRQLHERQLPCGRWSAKGKDEVYSGGPIEHSDALERLT